MAIDASCVDAQQDRGSVPGSSGYLGRGNARIEAEGDAAVAQVVWPSGKGRGGLGVCERGDAGALPDPA